MIDGVLEINWPNTLELARISEEMEFEALVPIGRWHGLAALPTSTVRASSVSPGPRPSAPLRNYSAIFATSHMPTIHPIMAAKQVTIIDHVTGGRFALNIVTGWNRPEIEMFCSPMLEHNDRYECAAEWLHILKQLWTRDEPFDFDGRFYNIKKGYLTEADAAPVSGGDERWLLRKGPTLRRKYCDMVYVVFGSHDFDDCKAKVDAYRNLARKEYGREI